LSIFLKKNDNLRGYINNWTNGVIGDAKQTVSYQFNGGTGDDTLSIEGYPYYWNGKVDLLLEGGDGNDVLTVSKYNDPSFVFAHASLNGGSGEFAYMLKAAAGLASPALRISHRMCAGTSFAS
jgi:Ca2+-binding RTX toxin-like protein